MTAELPFVDFSPFTRAEGILEGDDPTPAQIEVLEKINVACRDHGFLYLGNTGIPKHYVTKAFGGSEALFSQSEEEKNSKLSRLTAQSNMGFSPINSEQLNRNRAADQKEAFNIRCPRVHKNNFEGCPEGFGSFAVEFWDALELAGKRYCIASALALGLEEDYFRKTFERMDLSTIRMLHYPPCDPPSADPAEKGKAIRVGEHTDWGMFTFLFLRDGQGPQGLQIKPVQGGEVGGKAGGEGEGWLDCKLPTPPEELKTAGVVVNTGALLARWTNDHWRATAHRVVVPSKEVAEGHRYSIACFFDPDSEAEISVDPKFVAEGSKPLYEPTTGQGYLTMKIKEAQGA